MIFKFRYDNHVDAIYIKIGNKPYAYSKELDAMRHIDYASDNTPVGIELLYVSDGVITDNLPYRTEIEQLLTKKRIKTYA